MSVQSADLLAGESHGAVENVTGDVWEIEEGAGEEQQEVVHVHASALVSVAEGHSVEEVH